MKKMFTLLTVAMAALAANAQQLTTTDGAAQRPTVAKRAIEKRTWDTPAKAQKQPRKASSDYEFEAYYPAPDGVFYMGVDADMDNLGSYGYVPAGVELTFKTRFADYFNGDYVWDDEVENEDYTVSFPAVNQILQAPELYCIGYAGRDVYQMVQGGLLPDYGYYTAGDVEYYAANYKRSEWNNQFWDMATLSTNYAPANEALADELTGYKNITIRGFAERFGHAKDYWVSDLNADIVCPEEVTTDDVVAYVYTIDADGQPSAEPVSTFIPTAITRHDADSDGACYYVNFATPEPLLVKSAILVVIANAEGSEKNLSPDINVSSNHHYGEPGTSYIFADYSIGSTERKNSFIPYSDVAMWGNWSQKFFYLNHWTVGIKISYEQPDPNPLVTAISEQPAKVAKSQATFTLDGRRVSADQLRPGLYVQNGRKTLVK